MVELHYALLSGANVRTVKIERAGLGTFDFDRVQADIKSGAIARYLDGKEWRTLADHGNTVQKMGENLLKIMDVVAVDFSVKHSRNVQQAMLDDIFKELVTI